MKKFSLIQSTADPEELAMHVIMQNIPKGKGTEEFVKGLLENAIVVSIDGEPGIIWNRICGTEMGTTLKIATIKTCCIYKLPWILDNYIIFECFDWKCQYFFKIHLRSFKLESNDVFSPMAVHWCVYPSFEKVILIYPQITKDGLPDGVNDLILLLEGMS